jgi:hypothetical protein
VATTIERSFSTMKYEEWLRNRMGDEWLNLNDYIYRESDIFDNVDTEKFIEHFQNMKPRKKQL